MHCETGLFLDILPLWMRGGDYGHLVSMLNKALAQVHALPLKAPKTMREGRASQYEDVHLTN